MQLFAAERGKNCMSKSRIFFAALFLASAFSVGICSAKPIDGCLIFKDIAQNPEKTKMITDWVFSRSSDENFLRAMEKISSTGYDIDVGTLNNHGLDTEFLGFIPSLPSVPEYGRFDINLIEPLGPLATGNISSFAFRQGRDKLTFAIDEESISLLAKKLLNTRTFVVKEHNIVIRCDSFTMR